MISALTPESVQLATSPNKDIEVRKASMHDIPALLELVNGYAAKGIMLPRTEFELSEHMRDFSVAYAGSKLAGCGALHFYSPTMGEIRSLAVAENFKTHGIGRLVVDALVYEAKMYGLDAVFAQLCERDAVKHGQRHPRGEPAEVGFLVQFGTGRTAVIAPERPAVGRRGIGRAGA